MAGPGGTITLTDGDDIFPGAGDDNSGDEVIFALGGSDTVDGGVGNDSIVDAEGVTTTLNGGIGNDHLRVGNNITSGTVAGGEGDDTVVLNIPDPEFVGFSFTSGSLDGGIGSDTLWVVDTRPDLSLLSVSGFEVLQLSEFLQSPKVTATAAQYEQFDTIDIFSAQGILWIAAIGAAQTLDLSDELNSGGSPQAVTLLGSTDNETLTSGDADDQLQGFGGNDSLNGGIGADILGGGIGNDVVKGGVGNDSLDGYLGIDTADYSDATGNVTVNLGIAGAQAVGGGLGSDTLVDIENLIGSNFNDLLIGSGDLNTLSGGDNNDIYYIDALDTVTEGSGANSGIDTIYAKFNLNLASYPNVENLVLFGSGATSGTGTAVRNVMSARSNSNAVTFNGLDGDDALHGSDYGDTLNGGNGRDILLGYAALTGVNTMNGGNGDDVYYSSTASDAINENLNAGYDIVYTTVNRALSANTEYLYLYGAATSGTGNGLANTINGFNSSQSLTLDGAGGNDVIYGSNQDDVIIGGAGNDAMNGFGGNDRFRFATAGTGLDQIFGFDADPAGGQDRIDVSGRGFNAGSIGTTILIAQSGADTLITIGADSIRLSGVSAANVTATDFIF